MWFFIKNTVELQHVSEWVILSPINILAGQGQAPNHPFPENPDLLGACFLQRSRKIFWAPFNFFLNLDHMSNGKFQLIPNNVLSIFVQVWIASSWESPLLIDFKHEQMLTQTYLKLNKLLIIIILFRLFGFHKNFEIIGFSNLLTLRIPDEEGCSKNTSGTLN